ncbi:MAG: DMT family transporter, partial [Candidatus Diapherotrites archaeon]
LKRCINMSQKASKNTGKRKSRNPRRPHYCSLIKQPTPAASAAGSSHFGNLFGVLLAISGAIVYGLFSVLGKKQDYDQTTSVAFYYLFGFIYTLLLSIVTSQLFIPNFSQLVGLLWMGIFASALPFLFWFLALKHGDTAKISNIIYLTPFISLIYIFFLLSEEILISSLIGLVLIVAGIIMQSRF